jgi:hypothetical protein
MQHLRHLLWWGASAIQGLELSYRVYLEETITCHRGDALILCPRGHSDCPIILNNFAGVLCTHFKQSGGMEDLDICIPLFYTYMTTHRAN